MKKIIMICIFALILTGCSKSENVIYEDNHKNTIKATIGGTGAIRPVTGDSVKPTEKKTQTSTSKPTEATSTQKAVETTSEPKVYCNLSVKDEYYKYEYAYRTGRTTGFTDREMVFFTNLKVCLDEANKYTSLVDKEKAIHDNIIVNCRYDSENYNKGVSYIPDSSYSPEGVFYNGVAVCDGYSKAFKLCMDILGIDNVRITGNGNNGGNIISHAWNAVKLDDGEWYQVDITWDDPTPDVAGQISYDYFNVSDKKMKEDHSYTSDIACTADKYYYWNYYYDGMVVNTVDDFFSSIKTYTDNGLESVDAVFDYSLGNDVTKYYDMDRMHLATGKFVLAEVKFDDNDGYIDMTGSYLNGKIKLTYDVEIIKNADDFTDYVAAKFSKEHNEISAYIEDEAFDKNKYLNSVSLSKGEIGFNSLSYYEPVRYGKGYLFTCRLD